MNFSFFAFIWCLLMAVVCFFISGRFDIFVMINLCLAFVNLPGAIAGLVNPRY